MTVANTMFTPWMMTPADMQRHWADFTRKMSRLPAIMETARKVRVGATPTETVWRRDKIRLLRYVTDTEQRFKTPLVVVFALVNRPYILDLKAGKSVVSHFVGTGFDTYNIDWGVPTDGDRFLGLADYVEGYIDGVVDEMRERSGREGDHQTAWCASRATEPSAQARAT